MLFMIDLGQVKNEIFTVLVILFGTSCVFGTMIYTIERMNEPNSNRLFPSIAISVYYTILAITNVGFEGFLPASYLGKWIACAAITFGLFTSKKRFCSISSSNISSLVTLPLPLILSPYTRQTILKTKRRIYRDENDNEIPDDSPFISGVSIY